MNKVVLSPLFVGKFLPKIAFIEPEHLFIYIDRDAVLNKINFKADFLIIQDVAPKMRR